jgi:hypothetical protein
MPAILFSGDRVLNTGLPLETPPGISPSDSSTPALWLGALDPHSLCAQWEIPNKQLTELSAETPGSSLQLRVLTELPTPLCVSTETLDPSMQTAFVSVPVADTPYRAELGIRSREGHWNILAESTPVITPAETMAPDTGYQEARWFFTEQRPAAPVSETIAVIHASDGIQQFSTEWTHEPSVQSTLPTNPPSVANARRLIRSSVGDTWTESTSSHSLSRSSSLEEWAEENAIRDNALSAIPISSIPSSEALLKPLETLDQASADSPTSRSDQPPSPGRKFWFKINAEVTLYGSTEPNANVFIGSQKVTLRPDGTFTFRFALPNGTFPLPVVAIAADGSDGRAATVTLSRQTEFSGEVGVHPQDSALRPPLPQNAV